MFGHRINSAAAKVTGFEVLERFVEALQRPNHGLTATLHCQQI